MYADWSILNIQKPQKSISHLYSLFWRCHNLKGIIALISNYNKSLLIWVYVQATVAQNTREQKVKTKVTAKTKQKIGNRLKYMLKYWSNSQIVNTPLSYEITNKIKNSQCAKCIENIFKNNLKIINQILDWIINMPGSFI